jgi:hypothetical protein
MRPCRIANSSRCPWSSIYGKLAQEHIYWDKPRCSCQLGLLDSAKLPVFA